MKKLLAISVLMLAAVAMAERCPFERYQSIIDRNPFGVPPEGFDWTNPTASAAAIAAAKGGGADQRTEEQQALATAIHFSMINVTPDGSVAVGFTDNSTKTPIHYYLKVGESRNGWVVKSADAASATMTIEKGGVEVSLSIGEDSKSKGPVGKGGSAFQKLGLVGVPSPGARNSSRGASVSPQASVANEKEAANQAAIQALGGLRERKQKRQQLMARQQEESAAERRKAEEERLASKAELNTLQEQLRQERVDREEQRRQMEEDRKAIERDREEADRIRAETEENRRIAREEREAAEAARAEAAESASSSSGDSKNGDDRPPFIPL